MMGDAMRYLITCGFVGRAPYTNESEDANYNDEIVYEFTRGRTDAITLKQSIDGVYVYAYLNDEHVSDDLQIYDVDEVVSVLSNLEGFPPPKKNTQYVPSF